MDFSREIKRWDGKLAEIESEAAEFRRLGQHVARSAAERDARAVRKHLDRLQDLSESRTR